MYGTSRKLTSSQTSVQLVGPFDEVVTCNDRYAAHCQFGHHVWVRQLTVQKCAGELRSEDIIWTRIRQIAIHWRVTDHVALPASTPSGAAPILANKHSFQTPTSNVVGSRVWHMICGEQPHDTLLQSQNFGSHHV